MYKYLFFLFAFLSIPVSAEVVTLETIEWNSSEYHLVQQGTIHDYRAYADEMDAHLVTIDSQLENEFIVSTWGEGGSSVYSYVNAAMFIGISDEISEGNFRWDDGTPVSYTNWRTGEPNNANGTREEDYGFIYLDGSAHLLGFWNDVGDSTTRVGLIEKKLNLADVPAGPSLALVFLLLPSFFRKRNHG